jgi:hypothetical protein
LSASPPITRSAFKGSLQPIVPMVRPLVADAREQTEISKIAAANPEITRRAHLHRIAGIKRWMIIADGIARLGERLPEGFAVLSTEEQHNQGRYAFGFPGGVWTTRREPHQAGEERPYLQDALDGILEQAPLRAEVEGEPVFAYLSVPPHGPAKFIASHPALPLELSVPLDEFGFAPLVEVARPGVARPGVRSTRPASGLRTVRDL